MCLSCRRRCRARRRVCGSRRRRYSRATNEVTRDEANYAALHAAAVRLQQASDARPGLIAQQELDDAHAKDEAAAAQVDAAKSALSAMQQQLGVSQAQKQQVSTMEDYSRIVAPFTGVVTWRYADTGRADPGGNVQCTLQHLWSRWRKPARCACGFRCRRRIAPYMHDGDAATIRIDALGRTITGKVTRSTDELDMSTRSMQVEVDVPNADGSLTPGMYAQVTLNIKRTGDALVVPIQAVDTSGPQPFVLVVNAQNRVERRVVQTGGATANRIEVLSGLHEGEQVIVANQASFQPGELVTAKHSAMTAAGATADAAEGQ